MTVVMLGLALLLPWLLGLCWLFPLRRNPPLWLGYGYLLGMLVTTWVLRAAAALGTGLDITLLTAALAVLSLLGLLLTCNAGAAAVGYARAASPAWQKVVLALLALLLLVRYADLAYELWLRPLTPWDTWTTWGLRARVWTELGRLVPFVSPGEWLRAQDAGVYTIAAWRYPLTVSLIQTWPGLFRGGWYAGAANLPWLFAALALALGLYGQARRAGVGAPAAGIGIYLLLSLPLFDTHVALAGYADLWLASVYGLAALALVQWLADGEPWQLALGVLLALACPLIKLEGAVWAALLVPLLLLRLPGRWPVAALLVLAVAAVGWYLAGGIQWGSVTLTPNLVDLPYIGRHELQYTDSWAALADNLLLQGSWNLFWYLPPLALLLGLPRLGRDRQWTAALLLIGLGLVMLYVLFFYTAAEEYARRGTSLNRLFLHLTPVVLFWLLLLARPAAGTGSRSVPPPAR